MPDYAVLMHEDDHAWDQLTEDARNALLDDYRAWAKSLAERGHMKDGAPLSYNGRRLITDHTTGLITDGPFTETKEVLTGFFIIEAASLEQATDLARECPALGHGETVDVREIGH